MFLGRFVPPTSGGRAGQVGDIVTIQLVERTAATKSNAAGTQRDGNIGLTPPATGTIRLQRRGTSNTCRIALASETLTDTFNSSGSVSHLGLFARGVGVRLHSLFAYPD